MENVVPIIYYHTQIEIITDNNLLKFVFHSIEKLELTPTTIMEFEVFLKSSYQSYD